MGSSNSKTFGEVEFILSKDFYLKDADCPMSWEPGGTDFLSPCLEEAALMKRVLSKEEFKPWLENFLPQLRDKSFILETGKVSDRKDGSLVHLDGVNFSRAWSLNKIAEGMPEYEHLKNISNKHINYSLPSIFEDSYEEGETETTSNHHLIGNYNGIQNEYHELNFVDFEIGDFEKMTLTEIEKALKWKLLFQF